MLVICIAALGNILPLLMYYGTGDMVNHLVLIKCFSGQFWQGDPYPRWCMEANSGLGTPQPLFYFPLPYYPAALLYPLTHLGLSIYGVYIGSLFLATGATAWACYSWLKDIVSPGRALLAGLLFIFLPYRMEAMLFRSGYAELWGMVFLPLAFKYTRRLVIPSPSGRGWRAAPGEGGATGEALTPAPLPEGEGILPLAAVFGLLCMTHLGCASVAMLGSGLYLLIVSPLVKRLFLYAVSVLWGLVLAAFYIAPAWYYQRFLVKRAFNARINWADSYLQMNNVHYQTPVVLTIALALLCLGGLALYVVRRRTHIPDMFVRREVVAFGVIFIVALFLLFPVSAPFYALLGPLTEIVFPWRMQNLFMLALVFFASVWMQWLAGERRMKTWKADFAVLLLFLALMSYSVVNTRDTQQAAMVKTATGATISWYPRFHTRWTDAGHYGYDYFLLRYAHRNAIRNAEIIAGTGDVAVERWAWDGVVLQAHSQHGLTVRLNHLYFPIWSARTSDGKSLPLYAEERTGQMLVPIPAGSQRIVLRYSVYAGPFGLILAAAASVAAALAWLGIMFAYRRQK